MLDVLKNQGELFLCLSDSIYVYNKTKLNHLDFDNRTFVQIIGFNLGLDFIIHDPACEIEKFKAVITSIMDELRKPSLLKTIISLEDGMAYAIRLHVSDFDILTLFISPIDYYLQASSYETTNKREIRIKKYLTNFLLNFESLFKQDVDTDIKCKTPIFNILKSLTDKYYFLTNDDLDNVVYWLINCYNKQEYIFSTIQEESNLSYQINLKARPITLSGYLINE